MKAITYRYINISSIDVLFFISIIASLFPVWYFDIPAMVDLPQHVGQIKILKSLLEGNTFYSEFYTINWMTPYVVSNLIMLLFAKISTPLIAAKLSVSLYILTIPIISKLILELYNRPKPLQLLPIAFLYNVPFNWGFIPFLISISIGLIWLYLFLKHNDNILSPINILISLLLAFSHAIAWGVIVFNISIIYLYKNKITSNNLLKLIPLVFPSIIIIIWTYLSVLNDVSATESRSLYYYPILYKIFILLCSNLMGDDFLFGGIKLLLVYLSIRLYSNFELKNSLSSLLLISNVILFFICPYMIYSTAYFGDRVAILIPTLFALNVTNINKKNRVTLVLLVAIILSIYSRFNHQNIIEPYKDDFYKITNNINNKSTLFYITDIRDFKKYKYGLKGITYFIHIGQVLNNKLDLSIDFNFAYHHNIMTRNINKYYFNSFINYNYKDIEWNRINHDYILVMDCNIDKDLSKRIEKESKHKLIEKVNCWSLYDNKF